MDLIDDFMCSCTFIQFIYLLDPEKTNVSCNMCKQLTRAASAVQATVVKFVNSFHGLSFISILVETSSIIIANTKYQIIKHENCRQHTILFQVLHTFASQNLCTLFFEQKTSILLRCN